MKLQRAPDPFEFLGGGCQDDSAVGEAAFDESAGGAVGGDVLGLVGGGAYEDAVGPAGHGLDLVGAQGEFACVLVEGVERQGLRLVVREQGGQDVLVDLREVGLGGRHPGILLDVGRGFL